MPVIAPPQPSQALLISVSFQKMSPSLSYNCCHVCHICCDSNYADYRKTQLHSYHERVGAFIRLYEKRVAPCIVE